VNIPIIVPNALCDVPPVTDAGLSCLSAGRVTLQVPPCVTRRAVRSRRLDGPLTRGRREMPDNSDSQYWQDRVEHWHGRAEKTRALAMKAPRNEGCLLRLADFYERLAERAANMRAWGAARPSTRRKRD
jgi:hypothetical protein